MPLRLFLVCSLILNLVLAFFLGPRPASIDRTLVVQTNSVPGIVSSNIIQLDWRSVESVDYKEYVRNLRAIGCPEETVFDIIVADVNTLYAMKARSLASNQEWRFWEPESDVPSREEIRNQKLRRELEYEKRALIAAILGSEALDRLKKYQLWGGEDLADRKLAFLPEHKRNQMKALQQKYFDLQEAATEWRSNGVMTEETMIRLRELQQQQRAEIEALLTPDELENYDLRTSETADRLRRELAGSRPTEEEFRALYKTRKAFEEHMHSDIDVRNPDIVQARVERQAQLMEHLKAQVGEQRLSDFTRSQDIDYQNTLRLTQFFGLPEQAAADVYQLKQYDAAQARLIIDNAAFTEAQRNDLLAQLERDSEARLVQILGDRVFGEYRQNNRWWIRGQ